MNSINSEFSRLYREQYDHVVTLFRKRIRSSDDAFDLTQEVFILFLNKRRSGVQIDNPLAWLKKTAHNYLRNYQRERWNWSVSSGVEMDAFCTIKKTVSLGFEAQSVWNDIQRSDMPSHVQLVFQYVGIFRYPLCTAAQKCGMSQYRVKKNYEMACRIMLSSLHRKGVSTYREML